MLAATCGLARAQEGAGPFSAHVGGQITTAFSNSFGPDAESTSTFVAVDPDKSTIQYASTRGLRVLRDILASDRQHARLYVLGFAASMPRSIPGSTSLGISADVLKDLRSRGEARLALAYDAKLSQMDGTLRPAGGEIRVPMIVENEVAEVPAIRAVGSFKKDKRTAEGEFLFHSNVNSPLMIESIIRFSWEKEARRERIVRIAAGASMKSAMAQALATLRKYDVYGLHFEFDKANLLPESTQLLKDIAVTLKSNPTWTLQILGHTDSIGDAAYNLNLSADRAKSVATNLVQQGIAAARLTTAGLGETKPKGDNGTIEGRALNRRVELVRTDR